jgi:hypothetical protein
VNDLARMWKEAIVTLSRYLPGGNEENYETQSGEPVTGSRFEPGTLRIRSRSVNSTTTFGAGYKKHNNLGIKCSGMRIC